MYVLRNRTIKSTSEKRGRGVVGNVLNSAVRPIVSSVPTLLNRAVDVLPVELHLPGYRFCGPGTKLEERLARGERGINELDEACREHDIAYAKFKDNENRREADRDLVGKAWEPAKAWNSGVSERAYAAVAAAMEAKSALGGGICRGKKKKTTPKKRRIGLKRGGGGVRKRKVTGRKRASGLYLRLYRKN